jgi:hypothetical protein
MAGPPKEVTPNLKKEMKSEDREGFSERLIA